MRRSRGGRAHAGGPTLKRFNIMRQINKAKLDHRYGGDPKQHRLAPKRSPQFDLYAEWMSMSLEEKRERHNRPGKEHVVKGTDEEFARLHKVSSVTCSKWKNDPRLWDLRNRFLTRMRQHTAAVLRSLAKRCITHGQGADVKVYMETVEGMAFGAGAGMQSTGRTLGRVMEAAGDGLEDAKAKDNGDGTLDLTVRIRKYAEPSE